MRAPESHHGHAPLVAVIGGGASGTLLTAGLLRAAAAARVRLRIALIDRYGRHGLGQAYSTANPAHLLNAPAGRMSALGHDPAHLERWAAGRQISHDGFLSRPAYGQYLSDLLADAERDARPFATVSRLTSDVVASTSHGRHQPLRLHLSAHGCLDADVAVLATGSLPPAPPCPVPASPRYVNDPWLPGALSSVTGASPVVVLGTGLTMLDVAIAVTGANPGTVVHAVSRHALLPREHRYPPGPVAPSSAFAAPRGAPASLRGLIRQVRATAGGSGDWRATMDALRPHVPELWQSLTAEDQRLFVSRLARYWEVHRHRAPPATARRVADLVSSGRLTVHRGRVSAVSETGGGLLVRLQPGDPAAGPAPLAAGWLINATGPAADITQAPDPLLRGLLDAGLATPDPLRLGIRADADGALLDTSGQPSSRLFTLGPPLRGQLWETTAIPEIRDQAAALAGRVLGACQPQMAPGSAA